MIPTVTVDARQALARFSERGIPENVRTALRTMLPGLMKRFGRRVDERLESGLKTRRTLQTKAELVENPRQIVGRVRVIYTGADPTKKLLPQWLESGTRPHEIRAKHAKALFFFWERTGVFFIGPRVMHPGFKGIKYMENTLLELEPEIVDVIGTAGRMGAAQR